MLDLSQEAPDYKHYTPLHFALEEKNQDIVEMLVGNPERCADINVPPISGYADILEFACQESDEDYIKLPLNKRLDKYFCCLRTKEAIPPNLIYFYFEVKILRQLEMKNLTFIFCRFSKHRECVVGFCQSDDPENNLPGWHEGSFAYHGDDGGFYVSNAEGDGQKSDETFEENDIVGCGLNFETGYGYRTKNGILLGSSFRFQEEQFSIGRFYPCIGAKTNGEGDQFQLHITLRSSPEHPFHYKGPYNRLLLRTEWDDDKLSVTSSREVSDTGLDDETNEG
ncbi:hypothetical protein EDB82DRAFT_518881 [Fusarium venenatum]|uniref:uncharacterized protein n=1 Tax=Fusarium venenatum TaxID=56646 RepID=UPI001D2A2577|nr:hypothetical protein EDB82DRAFT_518881 [Fusarium venenatum]